MPPDEQVLAGRHSAPEFDEAKHKRDGHGRFAHTWSTAGLKQDARLGSRIKLDDDETLAGSASLPDSGIALAAINSPGGRKLRIGLNINPEDARHWSGADKGSTAVLDQDGVDKLRDAITRMQDGAKNGKELLKVFDKRETDLHKQQQSLLMKQYPKLTAAQGRELGDIDRKLDFQRDSLKYYNAQQEERLAGVSNAAMQEKARAFDGEVNTARAAGDSAAQADAESRLQALLNSHGANKDITGTMYVWKARNIDTASDEIAQLQARRDQLAVDPVPLSATDKAELDQVHVDLERNNDLWREFNDGSSLAAGTIPAQWGDIRWQASMSSDTTDFRMAVVPNGSEPVDLGNSGTVEPIAASDLKKLATLLDKMGATPDVQAAADSTVHRLPKGGRGMADTTLARRDGVELVKTGSWATMSGSWNPTPEDLAAAVDAQACPAIRRPIVKLGHVDARFDGQPALGWFENLRTADGGRTLLGDQMILPWLHSVQAAAYPSRSIEGNYNHTCSEGHTHKFVLTAVALLGVTPPAVQTIRNLHDLPAALGVAASEQGVPAGAKHVQVTILAAAGDDSRPAHTGAMIALVPTVEDAARLAVDGGEPAGQLHLTLAYLGEAAELGARGKQDVIDAVSTVVNGLPLLEADIFSVAVFNPGDATDRDPCLAWGLSGDMLDAVHDIIDDTLHLVDAPIPSQNRPWAAHITAAYTGDLGRIPELATKLGTVRFDRLRLAFADEFIDIPLMEWPGEEAEPADGDVAVAAAAGNPEALHEYWTVNPKGLAKWRDKPHPWTALFRQLSKFLNPDLAKRTASKWFIEVTGHTPNQKGVKASEVTLDVTGQDAFMDVLRSTLQRRTAGAPVLPAAEPEPLITDPKEDLVSTDLSAFRSRLGLDDTADEQAMLAAVDALKAKAETPAQPTPEMVAASAAAVETATKAEAEKDELRKEVSILASQVQTMSGKLADAEAVKAAAVKASVIGDAARLGKFTPAEREQWEADYDEAPNAVTRILASIAPSKGLPVHASGTVGSGEPAGDDAEWDSIISRIDNPAGRV